MSEVSVSPAIRAMEVGEPQRKWYIVPRELPVPAPLPQEEIPDPAPRPVLEPEPEHVG
ncbi:MAG: hypothetical protein Q7W02_02405 [Candidatus Rokubacteria bacterium]|nr:hypothetical protein [Candidatus Rokubacteria bacterium]